MKFTETTENHCSPRCKYKSQITEPLAIRRKKSLLLNLNECYSKSNIRAGSASGVVLQSIFETPQTIKEICNHIDRTPVLEDKSEQPANTHDVYQALRYVQRRLEETTRFRLVYNNGMYSVKIAREYK
jgi:hypothetical protein